MESFMDFFNDNFGIYFKYLKILLRRQILEHLGILFTIGSFIHNRTVYSR